MALLVTSLTVLLAGCSPHSMEKKLRFGWHTGVTKQAEEMRVLWTWSGVAALVVGVGVWGLIFWACVFHRKKNDELPKQFKYNLPLEIVYSVAPFVIIAALFYRTAVVEDDVNKLTKHPSALIRVDAFKWNWQFEYLSYQGQTTSYPGLTNPADPNHKQPYYVSTVGSNNEIPVLVVPKGQTVQIIEHSDDVIHAFWVPEFLFKRDVIPYGTLDNAKDGTPGNAKDNRFEFTATSTGSFVGRCAELCGTYHSQMNFEVRVVDPAVFQAYVTALEGIAPTDPNRQSEALVRANVPGGPIATTTYPFNTDRTSRSASTSGS